MGGRYLLLKQLAEGAFGQTFLAEDTHLPGRPQCVLKQLKPQSGHKATLMSRRLFNQEAEVLYTLGNHPQIPQLLAHFEDRQNFYLAQEYIVGRSLSEELKLTAPIPEKKAIQLIREILEVLVFVHQQQVIHRDLKPANLIRRQVDNKIVMIDFGAVKQVSTQFFAPEAGDTSYTIAIGTSGYIPNEQMGGRPRYSSDIYAVGIIGIQALTGVAPNELGDDARTGELVWRDRAAKVSPTFADFLDKMVRYDFRTRYANAAEALKEIVYLAAGPKTFGEKAIFSGPVPPTVIHPSTDLGFPSGNPLHNSGSFPEFSQQKLPAERTAGEAFSSAHPQSQSQASYSSQPFSGTQSGKTSWSKLQNQLEDGGMAIAARLWQRRHRVKLWYAIAVFGILGTLSAVHQGKQVFRQKQVINAANAVQAEAVLNPAKRLVTNLPGEDSSDDFSKQMIEQITEHLRTAQSFAERGNYDKALSFYQRVLNLDDQHLLALTEQCMLLNQLQESESALLACEDLRVTAPDNAVALWGLGRANHDMAFYDVALEYYEQTLTLHPEYEEAQRGLAEVRQAMQN